MDGCDLLKYILDLGNVKSLKELRLRRCARLEKLPNLIQLAELQTLDVLECGLIFLSSSGPLTGLGVFHLEGCIFLKELLCFDLFPLFRDFRISEYGVNLDK